jgi:RNA polymerase sigma-70 factor (ECF subfamily)
MSDGMDADKLTELVEKCRRTSSADAMNDLLAFLRPHVFRIACGLVQSLNRNGGAASYAADDLTNEALLRFYRNFGRIDHVSTVLAWFRTILRRMLTDNYRTTMSRPLETLTGQVRDAQQTMVSSTATSDLRLTLIPALKRLSPAHREILALVYLLGYTVPEAAEELRIPVGTAKSRVYHALRMLRRALQGPSKDPDPEKLYALAAA